MTETIDINDIAGIGSVRDTPPYQLPPEAWSRVLNMRPVDGGLEALLGWERCFGTPLGPPHFHMPYTTNSANFWLYASLTNIFGFDGASHANLTRILAVPGEQGPYSASNTESWNGTLLGGVAIFNNGTDVPQYWNQPVLSQKFENLPNWPLTTTVKVLRAFGPFLVGINVTDNLGQYPHMVMWSHRADPGSVPDSYDYANPAKDAGRKDLSDVEAGVLKEALPLANTMYLYKGSSVWKMNFIGGTFVFDFGESAWLPTIGILAPRCVAVTGDGLKHVWASQDDILWHNGNQVRSILNRRQRRRLQSELDTTNFGTSFMWANPLRNEMIFCYPSQGHVYPDQALIMNYAEKGDDFVVTEMDGITFRNAAVGAVEDVDDQNWEANEDTWEANEELWSSLARRRVVLAGTDANTFYNFDKTNRRDNAIFNVTLQREGLALLGKKRNGEWIVDHEIVKLIGRVWPKVQDGPIRIRLGAQQTVNGPVTWGPYFGFDPDTQTFTSNEPQSGRAVAVEFSSNTPVGWRIDGYKYEVQPLSQF